MRRENPSQHPCLCFETSPWTASRRLEKRRPRVPGSLSIERAVAQTARIHTHAKVFGRRVGVIASFLPLRQW